jgi:hypothetical protein
MKGRMSVRLVIIGVAACLAAQLCAAYWSGKITSPLWSIRSDEGRVRWLEIHNLSSAAADGMFHVEVMERMSADAPSKYKTLAPHMAVTEQALRASLVAPLGKGAVFPEAYDAGYSRWKGAEAAQRAFVCKVSVNACLAESPPN